MSDEAQGEGSAAGPSAGIQPAEPGRTGLQPHPLVERLAGAEAAEAGPLAPLPPDAIVLAGYPARDPEAGFWRVYEDLSFQSYLRIAEADVVATQTLATEAEPLRPSVVWVRRGADLERTRVETRRVQAGFLEGAFAQGFGAPALAAEEAAALRIRNTIGLAGPCTMNRRECSMLCPTMASGCTGLRECPCGGISELGAACDPTRGGPMCPNPDTQGGMLCPAVLTRAPRCPVPTGPEPC